MTQELQDLGIGLETAGVAALWLAVTLRAPSAVRSRAQRPLWLAALGAASALTLHLPWVTGLIFHATGPTHVAALIRNLFGILTSAAVLDFVLLAVRGRHTPTLYGLAALVMTALVWCDLTAAPHLAHTIPPIGDPAPSLSYWMVLITVNLTTNTVCAIACWHYYRTIADPSLRIGLLLFGTGGIFAGFYWLLSTAYIVHRNPWIPAINPSLLACYALLRAGAISVPLASAAMLALRHLQVLRRLRPLWRDLVAAVPGLTLHPIPQRRFKLRSTSAPLDVAVYRTVIEIRDAMLNLRAYVSVATLDGLHAHLEEASPQGADIAPQAAACWLHVARHAKKCGVRPLRTEHTAPVLGGSDLPGEIEFLTEVAAAYASPAIRALAARHLRSTTLH